MENNLIDFMKTDLFERGWSKKSIDMILGEPDRGNVYNRKRVIAAEKKPNFILETYKTEIKRKLDASEHIKKIPKDIQQIIGITPSDPRKQQKRETIAYFISKALEYNRNIDIKILFSFSLEEILEIIRIKKFKNIITETKEDSYTLEKELRTIANEYKKPYLELKKEFDKEPTKNKLEDIKMSFYKEKEARDKSFREITKVEDIENFYKEARSIKRNFKAYLGPTNSGKTHNAIQELIESETGVYLAPLRLLAREVYDLLKSKGIKVSLITGEEKIIDPESTHTCSTIEALDIHKRYHLAVIDEVQFLNDSQRGQSWTRAMYGAFADNIICLGSQNAETVIRKILNKTNENLEVTHLNRKTILTPTEPIYDITDIKKGDAIIAFSRTRIYEIKAMIEKETNLKIGVIYGMMPPEIRIKTATRFNEGKIDIIISTDAIGIGLNLEIQRIVFTDLEKYSGRTIEPITKDLFKQISGRAGRYKKYDEGFVTICDELCKKYDPDKWENYKNSLFNIEKDIEKIYFFPELEHLMKISDELNEIEDIGKIISTYNSYFSDTTGLFKKNFSFIDENLRFVNNLPLPLKDKYRLLFAPISQSNSELFSDMLDVICDDEKVSFDDLEMRARRDISYIEEMIQEINIFRWMSFVYPDNFEQGSLDEKYTELLTILDEEMIRISKGE